MTKVNRASGGHRTLPQLVASTLFDYFEIVFGSAPCKSTSSVSSEVVSRRPRRAPKFQKAAFVFVAHWPPISGNHGPKKWDHFRGRKTGPFRVPSPAVATRSGPIFWTPKWAHILIIFQHFGQPLCNFRGGQGQLLRQGFHIRVTPPKPFVGSISQRLRCQGVQ